MDIYDSISHIFIAILTMVTSFHGAVRVIWASSVLLEVTAAARRGTVLQLQKHFLRTTRKCQLQDQSQNIRLNLDTYVHTVMS